MINKNEPTIGFASRFGLLEIKWPALVLRRRQDQFTPLDCSAEMAAAIPGAKRTATEECGHLSTLERPDQVNAALRAWLGS